MFAWTGYANIDDEVNLVVNGDFSTWTDDTTPQGFDKAENCAKNESDYHTAPFSVTHTGGTKDIAQTVLIEAGKTYTISLWYKNTVATDDFSDARIWATWKAGSSYLADVPELKGPGGGSNDYLPNATEWTKYEVTLVAPATADNLNFEVRTYSSAVTLWDDLSVVEDKDVPAVVDTIAPVFADGFPYADNPTEMGFDMNFKASETAMGYGAVYDSLPSVTPTKAEIKARADAEDMAGPFPVGTEANMMPIEDLMSEHTYYVYVYMVDAAGNESGSVSMMMATTLEDSGIDVFAGEDFEDVALGVYANPGFLNVVQSGASDGWAVKTYDGNQYAEFSSYNKSGEDTVYLFTPNFDLTVATENTFTFDVKARYYNTSCLKVYFAEDYDGMDPNLATWVEVTDSFVLPSANMDDFASAGMMTLDSTIMKGAFAFEYVGNGDDSRTTTIQLDNIAVSGKMKSFTMVTGFEKLVDVAVATDLHLFSFDDVVMSGLLPDSVTAMIEGGVEKIAIKSWMPIKGQVFDLVGMDTLAAYIELPAGYMFDGEPMIEQAINFTANQTLVIMDNLNLTFESTLEGCKVFNMLGETSWGHDSYGYAKIDTYGKGANESWLVTPPVNVDGLTTPKFSFEVASYNSDKLISDCGAEQFEVYYSATAQPGSINPADWTRFTAVDAVTLAARWDFVPVDVDMTGVSGTQVFFAFRHKSGETNGTTWEVDNIVVGEKPAALSTISASGTTLSPNPATSTVQLSVAANVVEFISLSGRTLLSVYNVSAKSSIDVSSLNAGVYFVKVSNSEGSTLTKLIKK